MSSFGEILIMVPDEDLLIITISHLISFKIIIKESKCIMRLDKIHFAASNKSILFSVRVEN